MSRNVRKEVQWSSVTSAPQTSQIIPVFVRGRGYGKKTLLNVSVSTLGISKHLIKVGVRKKSSKTLVIAKEITQTTPQPATRPRRFARSFGVNLLSANTVKKHSVAEREPEQDLFDDNGALRDIFAQQNFIQRLDSFLPLYWWRPISAFMIIALVLVSPLQVLSYYRDLDQTKQEVVALTNQAINHLTQASEHIAHFDLSNAHGSFDEAESLFSRAMVELQSVDVALQTILSTLPRAGRYFQSAETLLQAGRSVSRIAKNLSAVALTLQQPQAATLYESLVTIDQALQDAIGDFQSVSDSLSRLDSRDIPAEYRSMLSEAQRTVPIAHHAIDQAHSLTTLLLERLGKDQWQRYLVLFANNNELRAVGGFLGSYAVVDVDRGEIKKIEVPDGGSYAVQGQLTKRVLAPAPLQLINARWEMHDANWWPDFKASAQKIDWFHRNAGGPSTDGVIVVTSALMERILDVIGPIDMPEYGRTITSENFEAETQRIVEIEYDKTENKPKKFLADFAPLVIEKIFQSSGEQALALLQVIRTALVQKDILLYFSDQIAQSVGQRLDWGGSMHQAQGDYLAVIQTNIAGGKTDGVIATNYTVKSTIAEDGTITNTLTITRQHNGVRGDNQFTGVQNNSYVRVYVPLGSKLISATGFKAPPRELFDEIPADYTADLDLLSRETRKAQDHRSGTDIYVENGKTVFGNWIMLPAGEVRQATLMYQLPNEITLTDTQPLSLLFQKQSGAEQVSVAYNAIVPGAWQTTAVAKNKEGMIYDAHAPFPLTSDTIIVISKESKQ